MSLEKTCKTCGKVFRAEQDYLEDTSAWRVCSMGHLWFDCRCKSTLMLPKGKFPWYAPDQFMSPQAKSVFNRVAGLKELPHIPNSIMQLQQLLSDTEVSTAAIAKEVKNEPIIAAEVLKIAENLRSLQNPDNRPLQHLEHAISYIGRSELRELVVAAALKSFTFSLPSLSHEQYWESAFSRADIGQRINVHLNGAFSSDEIYLACCLVNVGKIVGALCLPEDTEQIARRVVNARADANWRMVELDEMAVSHCVLGEIGAQFWGFPDFVTQAASSHHNKPGEIKRVQSRDEKFFATVALANQLNHWVLLHPERIQNDVLTANSELLGFKKADLEAFVDNIIDDRRKKPAA